MAVLIALLASLLLAACGSSSSGSKASSASASASSGTTSRTRAPGAGRFKAVRECLQKQGITLPSPQRGQPPAGGSGSERGSRLPKGVTRTQFEAALKKCGGFGAGGHALPFGRANNAKLRTALASFATCLRKNGVDVPAPNTSGKGPIFSTKGLDTSSPTFIKARKLCAKQLGGAFRGAPDGGRPPGTAPGGGGAPEGQPGAAPQG
ncbi:MAG TPA: hypothetical protein VGG08_11405 [Solirubrobacteraceae bacterium]|jgi:hypothetical protein